MARWFDEKFAKKYEGLYTKDLAAFGEKYQKLKSVKELPDFIKELYEFYKKNLDKKGDRMICNMLEPGFETLLTFQTEEEVADWFARYKNVATNKDAINSPLTPQLFKKLSKHVYPSIDLFNEIELFDDEVCDISEKEMKKLEKGNKGDSEDDDEEETSDTSSETTSVTSSGTTTPAAAN
jgi:hypothetical protein